jgi:ech hydrogenase subunit A
MSMTLVPTMIVGPLAVGVGLLCLRPDFLRRILVIAVTIAVCIGALALARQSPLPDSFPLNESMVNTVMMVLEGLMGLYILYVGIRSRRPLIIAMILAQTGIMAWLEATQGEHLHAVQNLYVDKFSVIMALINGVVGGSICIYALSYMKNYHIAHKEIPDRRPLFFSLLFVFMGAMFGIIFSNNLVWLYFFWEITTLCSFLLIGYTQKDEAKQNSLKALTMNLAGGVAFALAIPFCLKYANTIELQALIGTKQSLILLPTALLCFAGITKSAQFPFAGWLLGAMVAPTPVSALLHSSTMVKAGVYLVLRLAPVMMGTKVGLMVALVGAITFVVGSFAAIGTSDAKRVLAYSTVANLGLIVLCGGIGTAEAVWAGMLLIIFHAVAKCLLFLCVGIIEHKLHSRDIESMSGLIINMPKISVMMQIGMAGMFLAPFGMLISKWAVLKAVVDAYPTLSIFIAFGSAATLFFWVKWMGKLLEVVSPKEAVLQEFTVGEGIALYGLSGITFCTCLLFPFFSVKFVEPFVASLYGQSASLGHGNIVIMSMMMAIIMLFPLSFLNYGRGVKVMDAYLGGANSQGSVKFRGSLGEIHKVTMTNYYLRDFWSETKLFKSGVICAAGILVMMFILSIL